MRPQFARGSVRANCPGCGGAVTTFEHMSGGTSFGLIVVDGLHTFRGNNYRRTVYSLVRCAGCHRGGLAKTHDNGTLESGVLDEFDPVSIEFATIPNEVPQGIQL